MSFGRKRHSRSAPDTQANVLKFPRNEDAPAGEGDLSSLEDEIYSGGISGSLAADPADFQTLSEGEVDRVVTQIVSVLSARYPAEHLLGLPRGDLAQTVDGALDEVLSEIMRKVEDSTKRDLVTYALNEVLFDCRSRMGEAEAKRNRERIDEGLEVICRRVQPMLLERIDLGKALEVPRSDLARQIGGVLDEILAEQKLHLNQLEQRDLVTLLINDMLGLGPLEPLLADEAVTDIMVNGAKQVYVERGGKLVLTDVVFRDNQHVLNVAMRIVSRIGRRIDESSPLVDARLEDGSRVNVIIPPLAIDGPSISIRKFSKKKISLEIMEKQANISSAMAKVLRIAARSRLNIVISGGTGSGKTTMLNALSRMIDPGERVCTIEDAAELQLQQPHVVRLETRPPNLEGNGEITMRDLLKNTLRMRPDRIILGEIRGGEALDMLQAMNTGHDGSMCTIHANNPREAITRLENMVAMAGTKLPHEAVRSQIASAVHLVVQVSRMRDGVRRVAQVTEVVGMEGEIVTMQDLFSFEFVGEDTDGNLVGEFKCSGLRPAFLQKAKYFGLDKALMQAIAEGVEAGGRNAAL